MDAELVGGAADKVEELRLKKRSGLKRGKLRSALIMSSQVRSRDRDSDADLGGDPEVNARPVGTTGEGLHDDDHLVVLTINAVRDEGQVLPDLGLGGNVGLKWGVRQVKSGSK